MKTAVFAISLFFSQACSGCTGAPLDLNNPTAVAAVDIAAAVLKDEKPAVNAAIAELPDDVQLMAQMAYGALQAIIGKIDEMQPKTLAVDHPETVADTTELKGYVEDVKNQLDMLIH